MNSVIISIGSNIDPEPNITRMLAILEKDCKLLKVSEMVSTKPIGMTNQSDFMNGAALLETNMERGDFTRYLKSVEDKLGRDRSLPKFGPRTMDLDIIVWNGDIIDDDYYSRDFLCQAVKSLGFVE